jgi:hypothetical protein
MQHRQIIQTTARTRRVASAGICVVADGLAIVVIGYPGLGLAVPLIGVLPLSDSPKRQQARKSQK